MFSKKLNMRRIYSMVIPVSMFWSMPGFILLFHRSRRDVEIPFNCIHHCLVLYDCLLQNATHQFPQNFFQIQNKSIFGFILHWISRILFPAVTLALYGYSCGVYLSQQRRFQQSQKQLIRNALFHSEKSTIEYL